MNNNRLNLIRIIFLTIMLLGLCNAVKIQTDKNYHNMRPFAMGIERYTFFKNKSYELLQEGGDYTLYKGDYNFGKDNLGEYIEFIVKYFNYGYEEDTKMDPPDTQKYYLSGNDHIFILYSDEGYFKAFSYEELYTLLTGDYKASSVLVEKKNQSDLYSAGKLSDDYSLKEFWAEGVKGSGEGQNITISFKYPEFYEDGGDNVAVDIKGVIIFNGVFKSEDLFKKNGRVKDISIKFDEGTEKIKLPDTYVPQIIFFKNTYNTKKAQITIDSVYKGSKWDDTCLTKVIFFGKFY